MSSLNNYKAERECSIIIPVYKRYEIIKSILTSLSNQDNVEYIKEIIICDSEKDDDTMKNLIDLSKPLYNDNIIKHIFVENNISAKRNAGINKAMSENIIFIDDDCVPVKDFIIKHINMLEILPNSILCGVVKFDENYLRNSNYIKYRSSRHDSYNKSVLTKNTLIAQDIDFTKIVTMNMSCKKQLLIDNNLFFDEEFLGYGMEDNEFGWRAQQSGVLIKQCEATIIHNEIGDFESFCKKIYHIARDGIPKFISKSEEAVWKIPFSKYLEPEYPYHKTMGNIISWVLRNIIFNKTSQIIKYYLIISDNMNLICFNFLYKYVLAYYYIRGAKDRLKHYQSNSDTKDGFYINIMCAINVY